MKSNAGFVGFDGTENKGPWWLPPIQVPLMAFFASAITQYCGPNAGLAFLGGMILGAIFSNNRDVPPRNKNCEC